MHDGITNICSGISIHVGRIYRIAIKTGRHPSAHWYHEARFRYRDEHAKPNGLTLSPSHGATTHGRQQHERELTSVQVHMVTIPCPYGRKHACQGYAKVNVHVPWKAHGACHGWARKLIWLSQHIRAGKACVQCLHHVQH